MFPFVSKNKSDRDPMKSAPLYLSVAAAFIMTGGLLLASGPAFAAGIGDLAKDWKTQIESLVDVLGLASLMAGLAFGISGVIKLSKYADDRSQVELKQPLMHLAAGIMLVALPLSLGVGVGTIFGSGDAISSGNSTTGLGNIRSK